MSFKNYLNNNFANNQGLSYQDLNNLNNNDIILYNKINPMPRGIIGFGKITGSHGQYNIIQQTVETTEDTADGFKMIKENAINTFKVSFSVADLRLVRFSFFSSIIGAQGTGGKTPSYSNPGQCRAAFFLEQNNGEQFMLNSTFKPSAMVSSMSSSISMNYIAQIPAGTHLVKVGFKAHKTDVRIGTTSSTEPRPTQLFVEDLGGFIASGAELENEF
jgi:hypothetical protein